MLGAMRATRGLAARLSVARTVSVLAAIAPAGCGRIGFGDGRGGSPDGMTAVDAAIEDTAASADVPAVSCRANQAYAPIGQSAHAYKDVDNGVGANWAAAAASCAAEG